jgi:PKD repeat protein
MGTTRLAGARGTQIVAAWIGIAVWCFAVYGADDYSKWGYKSTISLNTTATGANVATAQAGFPVLIRLTAGNFTFAQAQAAGQDVRFATPGGVHLPYQIERWDNGNQLAEIWVKTDVAGNGTTQIVMYWGMAGAADSSNGGAVFTSANGFAGVWHMNDGGVGARADATGHGFNAVPFNYNGTESVVGLLGLADNLRGGPGQTNGGNYSYPCPPTMGPPPTNDYLRVANNIADWSAGMSFSVWAQPTAYGNQAPFMDFCTDTTGQCQNWQAKNNILFFQNDAAGALGIEVYSDTLTQGKIVIPGAQVILNAWHLYSFTINGTAVTIYRDGVQIGAGTLVVNANGQIPPAGIKPGVTRTWNMFGRSSWNNNPAYQGYMDEITVSTAVRSADWMKLCYQSQMAGAPWLAVGAGSVNQPSNLTYSTNPASYVVNTAITANTPSSSGGAVASYAVAPALPTGLTLNTTTGVITGTPTAATAQANYVVTATNAAGSTTATLSITVNGALLPPANLTYTTMTPTYVTGSAITSNSPSSTGGAVASYAVAPALPTGLTLNTTTGVITGTPTTATAQANYVVTATNAAGSTTATLTITINAALLPPANLTYTQMSPTYVTGSAITANNPSSTGGAVASYAVAPALPTGLTLNTTTGVITGTPTIAQGATPYTITATNTAGSTTATLTITVNAALLPPANLTYTQMSPTYVTGSAITANNPSSTGGAVASYAVAPALPTGLTLNTTTGVITGTPTVATAATNYVVTATNAAGSTTATLSITVNAALLPPANLTYTPMSPTYVTGSAITANTPSSTGGAVASYAVAPALPAGLTLNTTTGVITGIPTTATATANYVVTATNAAGSTTATLSITIGAQVQISVNPSNVTVTGGDTASFQVTVTGTSPLYQWQRSRNGGAKWDSLTGATSSLCKVKTDTADTGALFRCLVHNQFNSVSSTSATLTLCYPIIVTSNPANAIDVSPGSWAVFSVKASGVKLRYQWQKSASGTTWADLSGFTAAKCSVQVASGDPKSYFKCLLKGDCSSYDTASAAATLTVCTLPVLSKDATGTAVVEGQQASFSVHATGTGISFLWQRQNRGSAVWDSTGGDSLLTFTTKIADSGASFRCLVKGKCGADTGAKAMLTVYTKVRAGFIVNKPMGPSPDTVTFSDSTGGVITTWRWNFGDGTVDSGAPPKKHIYSDTGVFLVKLAATGPGGSDTATKTVRVYLRTGNPIMLSGRYLGGDSVELSLTNYDSLHTPTQPQPYVDSLSLFSRSDAYPDVQHLNRVKYYSLTAMKNRAGGTYRDTVRLGTLSASDTVYGFMTQLQWNDGTKTPLSSANGALVFLRDTTHLSNVLKLSARYIPYDSVVFYIDSVKRLDTLKADSVGLWYGIGAADTSPSFTNGNAHVKWWAAREVVKGASGAGRFTYSVGSASFNIETSPLTSAIVIKGKNDLNSVVGRGTATTVGHSRPTNHVVFLAPSHGTTSINLRWGALPAADSVERIRIYYRTGSALPLVYDFSAMKVDSILPKATDTQSVAQNLTNNTRYYFGAQVYAKGLWSFVTDASRVDDSTTTPSNLKNTIKITSGKFIPATNEVWVYWTVDTTVGTGLTVGITYSTQPGTPTDPTGIQSRPAKSVDSAKVAINPFLFDQKYYIALWLKRGSESWVAPTTQSSVDVTVPPFVKQTVRLTFYRTKIDTTFWVNGDLRIIAPTTTYSSDYSKDLADVYPYIPDSTRLGGFIVVGPMLRFLNVNQMDSVVMGLKTKAIPSPYTLKDARLYWFDSASGCWLVDRTASPDSSDSYFGVKTNQFPGPFTVMIDVQPPKLTLLRHSSLTPSGGDVVHDTVEISDNVGNVVWRYRNAKGGEPYPATPFDTLHTTKDTARTSLTVTIEHQKTGIRAMLFADDGRLSDSINLSRRVKRDRSDAKFISTGMRWTPLRATASLDNEAAKQLLKFVDTMATNQAYDDRYMRLVRWLPSSTAPKLAAGWVEYTDNAGSDFDLKAGRLFWIKVRNQIRVNFGTGITFPLDTTVAVDLNAMSAGRGWTDFGLPFQYSMRAGDILSATRDSAKGDSSAVDSLRIYRWSFNAQKNIYECELSYSRLENSGDFGEDSISLEGASENSGFTVQNPTGKAIRLIIPPISADLSKYGPGGQRKRSASGNGWIMMVRSNTGSGPVYCGTDYSEKATAHFLPLPPAFDGVRVGVVDEKSGALYGGEVSTLLPHLRKESASGAAGGFTYMLGVQNETKSGESVTLSFDARGNFPSGYKVAVYNGLTGELTALKAGSMHYTVGLQGEGSEYRYLLIGTESYIGSMGGVLRGEKLAFECIYPNPLRGIAHLRYSLPFGRVGRVEFSILDISGRLVWRTTVQERTATGGTHECRWNGMTSRNRVVAAGVYLVKMRAFDYKERQLGSFEQRITLLR